MNAINNTSMAKENGSESRPYIRRRDFAVLDAVGICAMTREHLVEELFTVPTSPVSATVDLIGVPAVIMAIENPEYKKLYDEATIAAIDGMPIVKIARKKGYSCDRCSAPDIMPLIFQESVKQGKTHYFYGGKDDTVLKKLRENLERDYPEIQIVGMYSPPFRPLTEDEDKFICDEINSVKPDFLWVGIGAPKQEIWMQQHQTKVHGTVMLGVGAGFDYFAGTLNKAPKWMETVGLEWMYRLIMEPQRLWKRYILGGFKWIYYQAKYRA